MVKVSPFGLRDPRGRAFWKVGLLQALYKEADQLAPAFCPSFLFAAGLPGAQTQCWGLKSYLGDGGWPHKATCQGHGVDGRCWAPLIVAIPAPAACHWTLYYVVKPLWSGLCCRQPDTVPDVYTHVCAATTMTSHLIL